MSSLLESEEFPSVTDNEIFLILRNSFAEHGFNEDNIRDHYPFEGGPNATAMQYGYWREATFVLPRFSERKAATVSGLDVLVHLFMGEEAIPVECGERVLGPRFVSALQELRLIQVEEGGAYRATVRIEPVNDLLVCADQFPAKLPMRHDYVYRPWDFSAQLYARIIPPTRCGSFLEMCCGSAYVCLRAARSAAESIYGVDINPRAVHFAEFNKKLNGIDNVTVCCGDLFEPVQSRRFDRVVAHPPYIPALVDSVMYKDGGVDGERVSIDLIRGLPRHLSDGGEFYAYLSLSDRLDAPAELRVREMLGADGQELDVALLIVSEESPVSFLLRRADPNPLSEQNEQLKEACKKLTITKFITTVLTIRNRRGSSPSTFRHRATGWKTVTAMAAPNAAEKAPSVW
jgi:SAM-dependent methyltransferase